MAVSPPTSPSLDDIKKIDIDHEEIAPSLNEPPRPLAGSSKNKDAALEVLGDAAVPFHITPEQDRAVLRKIDRWLMPVIVMVYFLQQLDKYATASLCIC